ncbi:putative ubiquitin-conjugating enzyme E2 38 isoform X2 [Chenopodium quinoa]|uniref:putative ubiquitin-conjugating enzyme E2 38 isoform X2 n=1 Tax=Chenopodium quinoa TaxID=63459 RepID=UPI000B78749F|nr:putative ubiquitin-conjugating enzyme E2 38 isoform X2 [Chenopodium quinoa]
MSLRDIFMCMEGFLLLTKDVLMADLAVPTTVLVSVDNGNGVKTSTSGSNNSADHNGSTSDLSFQDDAIDDGDDYVDDDVYSDYYDNDEYLSDVDDELMKLQAQFDNADLPPGVEASVPWLQDPSPSEKPPAAGTSTFPVQEEKVSASSSSKAESSSIVKKEEEMDEVLRKLMYFKQFDTVAVCSDHHYLDMESSGRMPSKDWSKKIQDEWKILEQNLPETIFVRVYESRMDLLRAVIIGPSGTPYHDGLFVFDAVFPATYPNEPPMVHYHSSGFRLNPNLYECGKVCLSLLNTWSGGRDEMWLPKKSTMLQVLVSIQALILNAEPFFNEPGFDKTYRGSEGKKKAKEYSEDIFIKSLKKMMYTIRNPPQHFEVLVAGHFRVRALDIMTACKAYADGAEVGCDIKKWLEEGDNALKTGSSNFKTEVAKIMRPLVKYFINNGSKDCEKFQS